MVSSENAIIIDLRYPILSANAPVNIGNRYNPPENNPEIILASMSENPRVFDKYNVITINTA